MMRILAILRLRYASYPKELETMKDEGGRGRGDAGKGAVVKTGNCPHPDHDHDYMVPDVVPALSRV